MERPDPIFGAYLVAIIACYMMLVQCVKVTFFILFIEFARSILNSDSGSTYDSIMK